MLVAFCDQRLRELDPALLEGRVVGVADHRVAELPLDLVEGVDAGGREAAVDGQSARLGYCGTCSAFTHQVLSCAQPLGWTEHPRARPGRNPRRGRAETPAGCRRTADRRRGRARAARRGTAVRCARRRAPLRLAASDSSTRSITVSTSWGETGRLWAARSSAARSLVRSNCWRSPSRLRTKRGSASRRSKVVKRLPQRSQLRRRRARANPRPRGDSRATRVVRPSQAGQFIPWSLLALVWSYLRVTTGRATYYVGVRLPTLS